MNEVSKADGRQKDVSKQVWQTPVLESLFVLERTKGPLSANSSDASVARDSGAPTNP